MAAELERVPDPGPEDGCLDEADRSAPGDAGPTELVVRRNAALSGVVGVAAAAMALGYVWRASSGGAFWDWVVCAVMAVVGVTQLAALVDARTPLLLADTLGVRVRLGKEWRGLPWSALDQVVVERRDGALRDGRLVLSPRDLAGALHGLDRGARRQVARTQRWYGAPLAVPLAVTTRVNTDRLVEDLAELAGGRTEVVLLRGKELANLEVPDATAADTDPVDIDGIHPASDEDRRGVDEHTEETASGRSVIGGLGTLVSRVGKGRDHDVDVDELPPADVVAPLREPRRALRAEVTRETPAAEPPRPGRSGLVFDDVGPGGPATGLAGNVRPIARVADPVAPPVIDDFVTQPALDPVIGPEIAAARTRAGLSIDQLSDRTRIRPHVLEAIEVDDFAPCGGDFYARGHLRTLTRFLGLDAEPMLRLYDERYAHAPINARRVFEAELATGMSGGLRASFGGPRWSLLIGAVLCLLMVWGVARFFTDTPERLVSPAPGIGSDSAGLASQQQPADSPIPVSRRLTVSAQGAPSRVVVRDRTGAIVWSGTLRPGASHGLAGLAPFRVTAADAAAVHLRVAGRDVGTVGTGTGPASRTVGGR